MTPTGREKIMGMRRTLMAAMALFPFFSGRAMAQRLPRQPILLPFSAAQKGAVLTIDFEVIENNFYTFILTMGFKKNDMTDTQRVVKLAGDGGYDPKTHKRLNNGLPIPLKLKISRLKPSGEISIYDKEIIEEELEAYRADAKGLSKKIDRIKLAPGNYRVRVEALRDIPELAATPIQFGIYIHRL